jgi:FG-GAP-like repeat
MRSVDFGKVLLCSILVLGTASKISAKEPEKEIQRILLQFGYEIGKIDGKIGQKTEGAIKDLLAQNGYSSFDLKNTQDIVANLRKIADSKGIKYKLQYGVDLENSFPLIALPPLKPGSLWQRYWLASWVSADFNADGLEDFLYYGVFNPDNLNSEGPSTGEACGIGVACEGEFAKPTLFLQDQSGNYHEEDKIFDNRVIPGQSGPRQVLIGDYNGDDKLDFFIADHGYGTHNGVRDSYFLSQEDGTWLESSETHLSDSNYVVFDHGAATGDLDGDGDLDIVITELRNRITCWMNSGDGKLVKQKCGSVNAFGIELADMDNDGDLDLIHAGHEYEGSSPTGIAWNDGSGSFKMGKKLPVVEGWGTVPEVSSYDLDTDGDMDIVLSRAGVLYVGTGIQVIENLGAGNFSSNFYPIIVAPDDFVPNHEGNEWNNFVSMIRFSDVNNDGEVDIMLVNNDEPSNDKVRGGALINQRDMSFSFFKKGDGPNNVIDIPEDRFITAAFKINEDAKSVAPEPSQSAETAGSNAFQAYVAKLETVEDGFEEATKLTNPVFLDRSGALVVGYKNFSHPSYLPNKFTVDLMIEYGSVQTVLGICVEFLVDQNFTGVTGSLSASALEGIFVDSGIDRPDCLIGPDGLGAAPERIRAIAAEAGLEDLLWDLQYNWSRVLLSMDGVPLDERETILGRFR